MIEIVSQQTDPDELDRLLIHEICHAIAKGGHGKAWRARMGAAARKATELGRNRLAQLLQQEIVGYEQALLGVSDAYQMIEEWVAHKPDLTLAQIKRSLAENYGLLVSEVGTKFRRTEKVFRAAKRDAMKARTAKGAWPREFSPSEK